MANEIERKFFVPHFPGELEGLTPQSIEQGYLALEAGGQEVRLRRSGDQYWLTVKSIGDLVRKEYEILITPVQFQALWPATANRRIRKDRYVLKREDYTVDIDVYHQPLRGLILAEVEFPSVERAKQYRKEPWMGREVTHLSFLKNRHLLRFESVEELMNEL